MMDKDRIEIMGKDRLMHSGQVSGYVRLIERKDGPMRGFADHLTLIPNKDTSKAGEGRQWVIQTQNFRFVV